MAYSPPSTSVCSIPPIVRGGEGNDHLVGRKPPPPLFYSIATGFPSFQAPLCHRPTFRESVLSETRWIKKTHLLQRGCYLCLAPGLSQKWCHDTINHGGLPTDTCSPWRPSCWCCRLLFLEAVQQAS